MSVARQLVVSTRPISSESSRGAPFDPAQKSASRKFDASTELHFFEIRARPLDEGPKNEVCESSNSSKIQLNSFIWTKHGNTHPTRLDYRQPHGLNSAKNSVLAATVRL